MSLSDDSNSRECPWCNEQIRVRRDGRLFSHKWEVGWDRDRDRWIMGACIGSGKSEAEAEEAQR